MEGDRRRGGGEIHQGEGKGTHQGETGRGEFFRGNSPYLENNIAKISRWYVRKLFQQIVSVIEQLNPKESSSSQMSYKIDAHKNFRKIHMKTT